MSRGWRQWWNKNTGGYELEEFKIHFLPEADANFAKGTAAQVLCYARVGAPGEYTRVADEVTCGVCKRVLAGDVKREELRPRTPPHPLEEVRRATDRLLQAEGA